jgi:hypothetical protein
MVISSAHTPAPPSESLGGTLAAAGRSTPIPVLAVLWIAGAAATAAILIAARRHWVLSLPFLLVALYGAWGLTEQGRMAVNRMQSVDATRRYVGSGILQVTATVIVVVAAIVSTILVFAVTFFIAGDAPVL